MARYLQKMETLKSHLGDLILAWGGLELTLASITSHLLCGSDERVPLFYTIVSNHARAQFLEKCVLTSKLSKDDAAKIIKIQKRFLRLNITRNKYVHSTYGTFNVGKVDESSEERIKGICISDLTRKPEQSEEFYALLKPLNASEIKNHCAAVYKLWGDAAAMSDEILSTDLLRKAETNMAST